MLLLALLAAATPVVDHALVIEIDPVAHRIAVTDTITLPPSLIVDGKAEFTLHAGLAPQGVLVEDVAPAAVPLQRGRVAVDASGKATLRYAGAIEHPPEQVPTEYQRSFQESPGTIAAEGVYLAGSTAWIPRFADELVTASVRVAKMPAGWSALSEGDATGRVAHPLDELHLVAGPFHRFAETHEGVEVIALLRENDAALAQRYLEVTGQYLRMYDALIGPYPWEKFALVENFWETGYGFPSFTLLGPKIIRFPFILHSSYPHELLHNWWGNSVYVDPKGGNWCEGLTAYLADHLVQDQNGKGADYRRDLIAKYLDFVRAADDFPLVTFQGRFSAASEAVGYGKWLMVLHMLRVELGDDVFVKGLQAFYATNKYQRAGYADVRRAFEHVGGKDLGAFFAAWTEGVGIPTIAVREARAEVRGGVRSVVVRLDQTQAAAPFPMSVPVVVGTAGKPVRLIARFDGTSRTAVARGEVTSAPVSVHVDPWFETFRKLDRDEVPPSLTKSLGAEKLLFVLPGVASPDETTAWRAFAQALCPPSGCDVKVDADVAALPDDAAVWILGYGNAFRGATTIAAKKFGARFDDAGLAVKGDKRATRDTSLVVAMRHPTSPDRGMVFVGADRTAAIAGLARKLPHYGKYGYLGFEGDEPTNVMKGQWDAAGSPMVMSLDRGNVASLKPMTRPLAQLPPPFSGDRMKGLVDALAAPGMEGRGYGTKGLDAATALVASEMKAAGLAPFAGERFEQCFDDVGARNKKVRACNVVGVVRGKDPSLPMVVLSAHVDHLGKGWPSARKGDEGKVHPGADDDASGVAAMLEVARLLSRTQPLRTIAFAAFTGEEAGLRGSRHFVASLGDAGAKVFADVNLDTVGRRGAEGFLVLDGDSASEWVHVFMGIGFTTGVKATLAKEGGGASDQAAFLEKGVPAVQLFGGPHADYHRPSDTADKVRADSLVDAAVVAREAVAYLADRKEPLTPRGAAPAAGVGEGARRASLGSVPDFEYQGAGVRFSDVVAGSGAAKAGLQTGDVLVELDGSAVADLRAYSQLLKQKAPGDRVKVKVKRGDKDVVVDVELGAR